MALRTLAEAFGVAPVTLVSGRLDRFGEFRAHPGVGVAERFAGGASAVLDGAEWLAGDVAAAAAGAGGDEDAGRGERGEVPGGCLALTAIYYDSLGWHTRQEYEDFARAYGYDITQWPGYPVMRKAREFLMVTRLTRKAAESHGAAAEATKRITALRTGASARTGSPTSTR